MPRTAGYSIAYQLVECLVPLAEAAVNKEFIAGNIEKHHINIAE